MNLTRRFALAAITFIAGFAALPVSAQTVGSITVSDPWVRALRHGSLGVTAYFQLSNRGLADDRLIEVYSGPYGRAKFGEMHTRGIVPIVREVEGVAVPAGADVTLRPGQLFVVLTPQAYVLRPGSSVPLTLTFERSGKVDVLARVTNQALGNR